MLSALVQTHQIKKCKSVVDALYDLKQPDTGMVEGEKKHVKL